VYRTDKITGVQIDSDSGTSPNISPNNPILQQIDQRLSTKKKNGIISS